MSLEYIRKAYNVPARKNRRIEFGYKKRIKGKIVGSLGGLLKVVFDGNNHYSYLHPTWKIKYF